MQTTLKPYADYRHSEIPWVRVMPAHWRLERAKWLFTKMDRPVRPEDETVTCFRDGVVTLRKNRRTTGFTESMKEIGYQGIRKGDLVIHAMDAFAGAVGVSDSDGKATPVYSVCRPAEGVDAEYYARVVREMARSQYIAALAKGIRQRSTDFRYATFSSELVPLPPLNEQQAISRFIIAYDYRVNRLIRAKQRLIALLTEQKRAIIQRAVTRGLDPDVPLKPSGVDWLGDVPEHWALSKIKNEFQNLNRHRVPLSSPERGRMKSRLYDYYGASGIIDKVDDYLFDDDLILVAEDGANLVHRNLPLAIVARGKFWVNNHAHILKPRRGNLVYWAHLLESLSYRPWITGAAQPKLTRDRLMSVLIPAPPPGEQDQIVDYIREGTSPLEEVIRRSRDEIALIREYRQRLVADVVTGKLDVRGMAVPDVELSAFNAGEEALDDIVTEDA